MKYCGKGGTIISYNVYAYCENSPVICVDACGTFLGFFASGCKTDKNQYISATIFSISEFPFYIEAKNVNKVLGNMYTNSSIDLIKISGFDSFREKWNSLSAQDIVVVNCHGNYKSMNSGSLNDIRKLSYKNIKCLILLACNAGHSDYKYNNVTYEFSKKINGCVLASDGTVYSWMFPYFVSASDNTWKKYRNSSKRKVNDGWVAYKNSKWYKMGTKQITIQSAIKKLEAKGLYNKKSTLPFIEKIVPDYYTI